ncbi:hypothetical protein pipiens_007588 [Culex pipiens pipiens]|uniref:Peptidase S1 domain-containing protein n=2 Tax=Culex pipiens TaxID=7175 RepID=A0ABD1DL14_CULPP
MKFALSFLVVFAAICVGVQFCDASTTADIVYLAYHRRQPRLFELLRKYLIWPPDIILADLKTYSPAEKFSPFIVGGDPTTIDAFPYQLSLRYAGNHICGASIISNKWALSAAHCLDEGFSPAWITLRGGSPHRIEGGYVFHVVEYIIHEKYEKETFNYDVTVLRISENFLIDFLAPIKLVDNTITTGCPDQLATVIGWGTAEDSYVPLILQELQVLIQPRKVCEAVWIEQITDTMICAGGVVGEDTCNGDSGGPLICNGYQVGIVSWGSRKCAIEMPAVFTDVANVEIRDFIRNKTGV